MRFLALTGLEEYRGCEYGGDSSRPVTWHGTLIWHAYLRGEGVPVSPVRHALLRLHVLGTRGGDTRFREAESEGATVVGIATDPSTHADPFTQQFVCRCTKFRYGRPSGKYGFCDACHMGRGLMTRADVLAPVRPLCADADCWNFGSALPVSAPSSYVLRMSIPEINAPAEPAPDERASADSGGPRRFRWLGADWRYLVRELAIVFFGVLIALAVNNWSIRREERAREREYLGRLAAELAADSSRLRDLFVPATEAKLKALAAVAPYVSGRDSTVGDTLQLLRDLATAGRLGIGLMASSRVTFEDLQDTGNLRLIRDAKLRGHIVAHYGEAAQEAHRIEPRRSGYPMYYSRLIPGHLFAGVVTLDTLRPYDLPRVLRRMRSDEAQDLVNQEISYGLFLRETFQAQAKRVNMLLREVRAASDTDL